MRRRKSSGDSHRRTEVAPSDHVDEGKEGRSDEDSGGECVDEEEGEIAGMDTLTGRGKTLPWAETTSATSQTTRTTSDDVCQLEGASPILLTRHSRPSFVDMAN